MVDLVTVFVYPQEVVAADERAGSGRSKGTGEAILVDIDKIIVGERFRKGLGDLRALMDSIEQVGLLHPIVLTGFKSRHLHR